jgi:hypothetical protein
MISSNDRIPIPDCFPDGGAMNKRLIKQIGQPMEEKGAEELLEIWKNNNRKEWSDEAFVAIHRILIARGVIPPSQTRPQIAALPGKSKEVNMGGDTAILVLWAVVGGILLTYKPIWLVPPHLKMTASIYIFLGISWVPVFLYMAQRWDHAGGCGWLAWRAVGILVLTLIVSCAMCYFLPAWFHSREENHITDPIYVLDPFFAKVQCQTEELPGNHTRYECILPGLLAVSCDYIDIYTFEGRTGFPFVKLANIETIYGESGRLTPEQRQDCSAD